MHGALQCGAVYTLFNMLLVDRPMLLHPCLAFDLFLLNGFRHNVAVTFVHQYQLQSNRFRVYSEIFVFLCNSLVTEQYTAPQKAREKLHEVQAAISIIHSIVIVLVTPRCQMGAPSFSPPFPAVIQLIPQFTWLGFSHRLLLDSS